MGGFKSYSGWIQIKPSLRVPPTIYLGMYLATATPYTSAHSRRSTDNLQRIEPGLCLYRAEQLQHVYSNAKQDECEPPVTTFVHINKWNGHVQLLWSCPRSAKHWR